MRDDDQPPQLGGLDRRTLLTGAAGALSALAVVGCQKSPTSPTPPAPSAEPASASGDKATATFVPVLAAMAARLLPSDDLGPGAADADVASFFRAVFADQRLSTVHPLLKRGSAFVLQMARTETKAAFVDLDGAAQDEIIRRLVEGQVRPTGFSAPMFVRVVMALTLEGFLGDPRHGGNKDGIGWRAVGFSPEGRAQGLALKVLP